MRQETLPNKTRVVCYESMTEMVQDCNQALYNRFPANLDKDFVGENLPTYSQAVQMLEQPWQKGLDTIQQFVERLQSVQFPELKSKVRKLRYDPDDGDEICIDRLRSGQEFWRTSKREQAIGQQEVTVIAEVGCSSYVTWQDVLWRGASAVALVKLLEERGYRCEVWMTNGGRHQGVSYIMTSLLKITSDVLDVSTLACAFSSWAYRTLGFNNILTNQSRWNLGLYSAIDMPRTPQATELDSISKDENRIFISDVFSFNAAANLIESELQKLNERV